MPITQPTIQPTPLPARESRGFRAFLRGTNPISVLLITIIVLAVTWFYGTIAGAPLVLLWAWLAKLPWRDLGFRRPKSWLLIIVAGIAIGILSKLLMKAVVMPLLGAPDINARYQYLVGNTSALPQTMLMVIFLAGFGEELICRGFLFERLGRLIGTSRWAMVAIVLFTSTLFGAAHYPEQGWMGVQQAFLLALVDATYFAITRQLWFLIVMHAAFDITAVFIIYFGLETRIANLFFP